MKTKETLINEIISLQNELTKKITQETKDRIKKQLDKICTNIYLLSNNDFKIVIESMIDLSLYTEAVNLIAESLNLEFKAEFLKNGLYFANDKDKRDIYSITLKRGARKYTFKFGQSIDKSGFYAKQGRSITQIDRKHLESKTLYFEIRNLSKIPFNPSCDKIIKPIAPTLYGVLSCMQKYDVGTFENFCDDFGYDNDTITAKETYKAVVKEYDKMCSLFSNEELEVLQLIY